MATSNDHNPLTEQHLEMLNQALQMMPGTASLIAKLRASGWDVEKAEEQNNSQREIASALKRNFFPQAP